MQHAPAQPALWRRELSALSPSHQELVVRHGILRAPPLLRLLALPLLAPLVVVVIGGQLVPAAAAPGRANRILGVLRE